MDRKFKVNDSAAGDAPTNQTNSKEAALEKLRKMEWKRNTQETWHLARSNNRGSDVRESKKYNKDEDNYFEGKGIQKTKKLRKPRASEDSRSCPTGFSMSQASAPPPQVNAWAQKKGSALFQREDEVDEDDQLLKLVLQESLKSAEEDKKRRMERYMMTNLDLPSSTQTMRAEKDWQEEYKKEDSNNKSSHLEFQENSPESDLHFVETDIKEESPIANQRHRSILPRTRKTSPQEKSSFSAVNKNISSNGSTEKSTGDTRYNSDDNDFFEPSRPEAKYSNPNNKVCKTTTSLLSCVSPSNSTTMPVSSMKHTHINSDNLSTSLNSALTFGDTQGIFEQIQGDSKYKQTGISQNLQAETPTYLPKASDNKAQIKPTNPSEPSEMDILLHSFIRHEPPSSLRSLDQSNTSEMSAIRQFEPNSLFTSHGYSSQDLTSAQCYTTHQIGDAEQHPVMNGLVGGALPGTIQILNGRDSGSSVSGSPLPNITPYGSLEKEIPSNVRAAMQATSQIGSVPYGYSYNVVESNPETLSRLQTIQFMNQNISPVINPEYSSVPPQIRGVVPVNPQVGQPQYRLPNASMIVPPFQGQAMPPLLQHQLQAQMQQMQIPQGYLPHMVNLNTMRLQQSQQASGIAESDDNPIKEHENTNKPNQPQSQAQVLTQNQQHVLQLQNHPQIMNQPQGMRLVETASPTQDELLQQHSLQGMRPQPAGKTTEELQIEYQNAIQALRRVQEEMQEQAAVVAQVRSPVSLPQAQPPWGVIPANSAVPMAINQFFPVTMMPQVHPHLIQQSQNPTMISPAIQHIPQNLTRLVNIGPEMNLESEINTNQESDQTLIEPKIGRGRGRLH